MKRMHLHVAVDDLAQSTAFYSALFGGPPTVAKPDYAKWMLEDPRVNFAISARGAKPGLDHLGLQVDNGEELNALRTQMSAANISTHSEGETTCCYARSEKSWVQDPSGIAWEAYHTMGEAQFFNAATQKGPSSERCGLKPTAAGEAAKTGCC